MEYIFICPKCSAVFGCADTSEKICSCGANTVFTGYTSEQWYALPREAREKIKFPPTPATDSAQCDRSPSSKSNPLKKIGIVLIIVGFICGLLGAATSASLAVSHKGHQVTSGYFYNGEYHELDSFVMGGNSEAVSYFNGLKVFFIAVGAAVVIAGIVMTIRGKEEEHAPALKKRGMVIDTLDHYMVTIEFNDGTRKNYWYNPNNLILLSGDFGDFEIKGQTVIGFEKRIEEEYK